MAINIINQNLDQFGLPYGEGQRITPQNFVPTMPMRDPNYGIPAAADQMAFRPNSMKDRQLKQLDVDPSMDQKRYDNLRKEDVEQFNEKGIPLSLPNDRYKGIEGYTAMAMDPNRMTDAYSGFFNTNPTTNRNFDRDFSQLPSYGDAISRTNVQGMDLEMDPAAQQGFLNPNIQPSQNMFQRAGNFINDLDLEEYLPFIGEKSLTGMLGRGIGNLFQNIAPARYGYSTDRFNRMTPGQQSYTSNLYGPGGLLQGYNQKSAFGLGALGTLGNRLTSIQNRKAPQTDFSRQRQQQIKDAINETINTGEREALADPNRSVQHPGSNIRTRTDIDVADGGAETSGGKIVCTMMNDSYGFGNFRNKIWLKHSKDLPKEYEVGYHKIFLPLVKFAKGEGKLNKVVKKTLEHIARHRTLDLKQEMKGKTHILGRVYRKILEPICFLVGKASMFVRRR